jgi:hypothetical protein
MSPSSSTDTKDFPTFGKMNEETYNSRRDDLFKWLCEAAEEMSFDWNDIKISIKSINETIDMVQRREIYFHVYHHIEMGELNEACLNCFWIMKFCPFYYT